MVSVLHPETFVAKMNKSKMAKIRTPQEKGRDLEKRVMNLLEDLKKKYPERVDVTYQPKVKLQSGEVVKPDIDLSYKLPHSKEYFYIECQDRKRNSKGLLYKIQYIRNKHWRKSFIIVYAETMTKETLASLKNEGAMVLSFASFSRYIKEVDSTLSSTGEAYNKITQDLTHEERDHAMVSEVEEISTSISPLRLRSPPLPGTYCILCKRSNRDVHLLGGLSPSNRWYVICSECAPTGTDQISVILHAKEGTVGNIEPVKASR